MLNTNKPGQGDRPANYTWNRKQLRIATPTVGTIRGRSAEIEILSQPNVDICCVQETRWKGESVQKSMGKNWHYKFFGKRR